MKIVHLNEMVSLDENCEQETSSFQNYSNIMFVLRCHFAVCLVSLIGMTGARIYERCDFARTLRYKHKLSLSEINVWACIAQYQSGFSTDAVGYDNDGTGYHGMFQISDRYWCSTVEEQRNACDILCSQLVDDDLTDDFNCVKKIFEETKRISGDGYSAWTSYKNTCQYVYEGLFTDDCFVGDIDYIAPSTTTPKVVNRQAIKSAPNRIYDRCELARELWYVHQLPADQIATWVCIAKHESNYNTSAVGSGDHGLFQISDIYWCSPPGRGWVCGLSCAKLEDSDITDDVECMKKIHEEHQRLSGDGFNAWSVYKPYCKDRSEQYIDGCFDYSDRNSVVPYSYEDELKSGATSSQAVKSHPDKSKIFERCELAVELYKKHNIAMELVPIYVCIAYHESKYNTSAVGHLNIDGSGDHGIFQISDIYWCSPPGMGRACGLSCDELKDSDISNDVECMKKIYDEHERLSGDGFNAWSVYTPYCKGQSDRFVDGCFDEINNTSAVLNHRPAVTAPTFFHSKSKSSSLKSHNANSGKIYERCELANELLSKHNFPMNEISNWVCIAYHESKYDTSAVGRLNADGSADHGLFQISDIYWCSLTGRGKGCSVSCSDLENSNITDDIQCVKQIFNEHRQISGDGFTAWSVYLPYCKGMASQFTDGCFEDNGNSVNSFSRRPGITSPPITTKPVLNAKIYSQCELAIELRDKYHLLDNQIATWVCIAVHGSSLNTSAVKLNSTNGSSDHGIFQINDKWCSANGKVLGCGLACSELEDSNLLNDVACLKIIYQEQQRLHGNGFHAWTVYNSHCKHKSKDYVKGCFHDIIESTTKPIEKTRIFTTSVTSTVAPKWHSNTVTNDFVTKVHHTTPSTVHLKTISTVANQFTTKPTITTQATYRSTSTVLTERERVQNLFNIYFNGFRTPAPTTQKSLFSTTHRPISNFAGNIKNINSSLHSPYDMLSSKNIDKLGTFSKDSNATKKSGVFSSKKGTGFVFGVNVPTVKPAANKIYSSSSVRPTTKLPFRSIAKSDHTLTTTTTKFPSLNSYKSSADTRTISPFIRQNTPATVNSKITYQSISQRPSLTTSQSLPAYYSNRLTSTTTNSPTINQIVNTHDNSVSMFNRFTRAPSTSSSTPNNNLKLAFSSEHTQYHRTPTTHSPFDKIFDLFVH